MSFDVVHGTVEDFLADCEPESFDLIHADGPYFRVLAEDWDRQWSSREDFLGWLGGVLDGFRRVLKPNGSLYAWASASMAAAVEEWCVRPRFSVLSSIVWKKSDGTSRRCSREELRAYLGATERCIFAEHLGADGVNLRESGYGAKVAGLRSDVFESLRAYLDGERRGAGITVAAVNEYLGTATMAGHYFGRSQWALPTAEVYAKLQELFNGDHLRREYEDLRREYEDLRREYEDLRRPFFVSERVTHTDVWEYESAERGAGRHPAEKPLDMMRDIVRASTRPGARVLDAFAGSGSMSAACIDEGRDVVAVEKSEHWARETRQRCERHAAVRTGELHRVEMRQPEGPLMALFE